MDPSAFLASIQKCSTLTPAAAVGLDDGPAELGGVDDSMGLAEGADGGADTVGVGEEGGSVGDSDASAEACVASGATAEPDGAGEEPGVVDADALGAGVGSRALT